MTSLNTITSAQEYSHTKLEEIRLELEQALSGFAEKDELSILTCGSFARGEASKESDMDYCIIFSGRERSKEETAGLSKQVSNIICKHVPNPPGSTGTFGGVLSINDLLINIGGENDSNIYLTKRILILLEGTYLYNEKNFKDYQKQLLNTYIKESVQEQQLPMFFLNDVIRYYRTICTDFEYKTAEENKPWGIRNIKLIFSRKLLYFSGIVAIADSLERRRADKIDRLDKLFSLSPIERIQLICGNSETEEALLMYDKFLRDISDAKTRNHLKTIVPKDKEDKIFREIKNEGHVFSHKLTELLTKTFPEFHQIHHSLIM